MVNTYLGNCIDVMKTMKDNSIDLVIIDPPYVIDTDGGGIATKRNYYKECETMNDGIDESILDELCRLMKKINIYIWCSQKQLVSYYKYFVEKKKCNWNILSWHKNNPIPACCNKYLSDTEYILFFREKGVKVYGEYKTKFTYYVTPCNKKEKNLKSTYLVKPLS